MDWLALTALADEGSFTRGEDYAARGLVEITGTKGDAVQALAHGSTTYDVALGRERWGCTCPVGISGLFCKHLVATALLAAGAVPPGGPPPGPRHEPADRGTDIARWLTGLDPADAAEVVRDLDQRFPEAVDALERLAARSTGDLTAYADLVDSLKTRRFLDYSEANDHGRRAHAVVEELASALTPANAAELRPLLETGIRHLVRVIQRSDDSSGLQGDAAVRLIDLHAETAALARPDPVQLARWLVRMGVDEQDFFELDVVRYAEVLGERGLATYRKELDKRLAVDADSFWANRGLKRLAVLSGDVDEIVRLVGGGLAGPHAYLDVTEALLEAGHRDEALRWAVEGTGSRLVPHQTVQLYDVAVRLLLEREDHAEVLRLRREQLARIPDETAYRSLRLAATSMSVWPLERLAALDVLLERNPRAWLAALLEEGEVDLAWESSLGMELDRAMCLTLLRARAKTRPGDVFGGYVALIEGTLERADQRSYRQAIAELGELRTAARAAGLDDEYAVLVQGLLEKHRRRPTLVTMLRRLVG